MNNIIFGKLFNVTSYYMNSEQIEKFKEDGYIVIENILNQEQINIARTELHNSLKLHNIDHDNIINFIDPAPNETRIKSDVANIFYSKFKIDLQINKNMYNIWKSALDTINEKPFGPFDNIFPYIDRICWRLPDIIKTEGGLGLHIDRRPGPDAFTNIKKYRPIQGFIALTDHYGSNSGGLKLVPGFHKIFNEYFSKDTNKSDWGTSGDFYRMNSKSYVGIQNKSVAIDVPAGSLVLWDNRLPHGTCDKLSGHDTREVIYLSWIPNVPINQAYVKSQAENIKKNIQPPAYLKNPDLSMDRNYEINDLSEFQKTYLLLND